ncbi:MAG TPA: type II secretion system protein [Candidatus Paceibacterota bacterium]
MKTKGFTLIEVLVSVSIFAMVMLVATGAVFSIVQANKKTHSLKSVMTNLNFALEAMMRDIRLGSGFSCDGGGDCVDGGTEFRFLANRNVNGDSVTDSTDIIAYGASDGAIMKQIFGGSYGGASYPITAPEIVITSLKFYVIGTGTTDTRQPKVIISIQGYAGAGTTKSEFNIETMVSQRAIDS